jgi:hypothetical protein
MSQVVAVPFSVQPKSAEVVVILAADRRVGSGQAGASTKVTSSIATSSK